MKRYVQLMILMVLLFAQNASRQPLTESNPLVFLRFPIAALPLVAMVVVIAMAEIVQVVLISGIRSIV